MDAALKAMADPRRREILRLVWNDEFPATRIAAHFDDVTAPFELMIQRSKPSISATGMAKR